MRIDILPGSGRAFGQQRTLGHDTSQRVKEKEKEKQSE